MPDRDLALRILARLRRNGHTAYLAGGCVRDELLGAEPQDYDVATDATPERIQALFARTSQVGAHFGVVIVRDQGSVVEVATFRADGPYSDRRRPDQVRFSTPGDDARRRDFTINALFLDPDAERPPQPPSQPPLQPPSPQPTVWPFAHPVFGAGAAILDFVGGVADLRAGLIRAVGDPDQRFQEDDLRTLRAVRFAARLGFRIEPDTAAAITRHAGELRGISRERIGDELRRMLRHPARAQAVASLQRLALDGPVLGETPMQGPTPALDRLGLPTPGVPESGQEPSFATALAAWALDRGVDPARPHDTVSRWRTALCLSNDERDDLLSALVGLAHLQDPGRSSAPVAARKRTAASPWFARSLALLACIDPAGAARVASDRDALARTPSGLAPRPLLSGDDLVRAGIAPGPAFKKILDLVYDAQLEEKIQTPAQALELARGWCV